MVNEKLGIELIEKPKPIPEEDSDLLSRMESNDNRTLVSNSPVILTFCCDHCSYEAADKAGSLRKEYPDAFRIIRVPCTGRIEPEFLLEALLHADAVLILGCHPGNCHFKVGNYEARKRYGLIKRVLRESGLDESRIRLDWVGAGENDKFVHVCKEFYDTVKTSD